MTKDDPTSGVTQDIRVHQERETGVREVAAGNFRLRYLFARSADTRQAGEPGQDYIALRHDGRRLAFALCDGVSQSFYGDLAARFLGNALVAWLWDTLPPNEFRREAIQQALRDHLQNLIGEATEEVLKAPLPEDAPPLLRDALEQKRAMGSQAMFVCGSIELPGPDLSGGRMILAWLGDSELQLWGAEGDRTQELGAEWLTERRWSTKDGPKGGPIGVFVGLLRDVKRVLAYSDGIASLRERLGRGLSDEELEREVEQLGETATSDDISFLEIELLPEMVRVPIPVILLAPALAQPQIVDGRILVSWDPVPGTEIYELEWTKPIGRRETVLCKGSRWVSQVGGESGEHTFRVRALTRGQSSTWSPVRTLPVSVSVSPPSPPPPPLPPPPPRRRPWFVYAGAVAAFVMLCLLGSLVGGPLVRKMMIDPSPTTPSTPVATATWAVEPTAATSPTVTATLTASPTAIPIPTAISPESPQPTPTSSSPLPTPLPPTESPQIPQQVPEVPPLIAPLAGEDLPLGKAMVAVGGTELAHIESELYEIRIAQREIPGYKVRFSRSGFPGGVSPDQVRWVWLVYRPNRPPTSPEPVVPLLVVMTLEDDREQLWGPAGLQEGQEAWVFGVNASADLGHFLPPDSFLGEPGAPILVRGTWYWQEGHWRLEVAEWYQFDRDQKIYVPSK
ncbi:MAG: protein phosphatase 2C domain-containing protein [Chloroflexota bacterium]|nr:protein phosphatase 2C domain-containing protein [Chloroflexota bacterium]